MTAVVLAGGLALVYGYLSYRAEQQLREALATADAQDPGWQLEALEASRAEVPEETNSAAIVARVGQLLPPPNQRPDWQLDEQLRAALPCTQFTPEETGLLRSELAKAAAAVAEARKLAGFPEGRHHLRWAPDVVSTALRHVDDVTNTTRLLWLDTLLRLQDGDLDGSLVNCRALVNAARSLGDEPVWITQLVRIFRMREAVVLLERILAQGQLPATALAEFQQLLEADDQHPYARTAMRAERALMDEALRRVQDGEVPVASLRMLFEPFGPGPLRVEPREYFLLRLPGALRTQRAAALRYGNQALAVLELPLEQQVPAIESLDATLDGQPLGARLIGPQYLKLLRGVRNGRAALRCGAVLVAVERFRLAEKRWPSALEELVPAQLGAVPTDPMDGQPLRFRRLPDGVVVYSIGPDGKDDSGKLDRKSTPDAGMDLGFRLWDVERRRQPPAPVLR